MVSLEPIMVSATALADAADGLLETAIIGGDWRDPLAALTSAAAARGATLVRQDPLLNLKSKRQDEFVLSTESIAEPVADYLAGVSPPDPRSLRVCPTIKTGFQTDFDQFTIEEINKSPFYQEFLRQRDLRWHACALIDSSLAHGDLFLSLKRAVHHDHYSPQDIASINDCLPKIRLAATISRAILQSECLGVKRALADRNEALFELNPRGRVVGLNRSAESLAQRELPLRNSCLLAPFPEDQSRLDGAIAAPLADPAQVACIVLKTATPGRRLVVRTVPVAGKARDIFVATVALALVTIWDKPDVPPGALVKALRDSFDLTSAEARVAALVGLGVQPAEASRILEIGLGTARNYLKAAQSKIGVSRQAELASLVAQMRVG